MDEFFLIPILNNFKTFLPLSHMFVRWKANLVRLFSLSVILVISEKARFCNFANFSTSNNFMLPPQAKVSRGGRSDKKRFASFIKGSNSHTHTLEALNYHWANFFLVINLLDDRFHFPTNGFSSVEQPNLTRPNPTLRKERNVTRIFVAR